MKVRVLFAALSLAHVFALADGVDFIQPKDGDTLEPTFLAKFAVTGMEVALAGEIKPDTGHHHLLINAVNIEKNVVIPNDNQHKHYGKGQTEAVVFLQPGKYKLTLQFADGAHRSYGEAFGKSIYVTVEGKP
ncbi:MAG: DUF4399 domain-containing protein [Limnohabitans sp.]|nr:DUF4399 domain-containing protein [Limnohabitans sp.]